MLNCGHSFCDNCLELLFKSAQQVTPGRLTCPTCLVEHSFPNGASDLQKLIKNFTLLSLIEAAKGATAHSRHLSNTPKSLMAVPNFGKQGGQQLTEEFKNEDDVE